jgi:hypothetical protein
MDWTAAIVGCAVVLAMALTLLAAKVQAVRQRDAAWASLMSKTPWTDAPLDDDALAALPDPAQRFLRYAIPGDTPLRTVAVVATTSAAGAEAYTIIAAPHGWIRRSYAGLVSKVSGFSGLERLEQRWWGKLVPLTVRPADMAERAAIETVLWVPIALCGSGVTWAGVDTHTTQLTVNWTDQTIVLTLQIAENGKLAAIKGTRHRAVPRDFAVHGGLRVPTVVQIDDETITLRHIRLVPPYKGHSHA